MTTAEASSGLCRRQFLAAVAAGTVGLWCPPSPAIGVEPEAATPTRTADGRASAVIILHMLGGMSHLDTFDPKTAGDSAAARPPIATRVAGQRIGAGLPRLAGVMDRCALIRSLHSTQGAHPQGQYLMRTGYRPGGGLVHPALGAWDAYGQKAAGSLPSYVTIAPPGDHPGAGFLPPHCQPLPILDPASGLAYTRPPVQPAATTRRQALVTALDLLHGQRRPSAVAEAHGVAVTQAMRLLESPDLAAFDLQREPAVLHTAYGDTPFAQGCLLARRLVAHGVHHVEVSLGGWDSHDDHDERVADTCAVLDQALTALISDLETQGLLPRTLVAVVSEFGRSPERNDRDGRDHHPAAFSALLAGGGVRGGLVHGATDARGAAVIADPVSLPDLLATIAWARGLPLDQRVMSPTGRPLTVADRGRPLTGLFV
jgi:uncharacterized protein (DUF1501 family)